MRQDPGLGAGAGGGSTEFRADRYEIPGTWENYLSNDEYCLILTTTGRGLSFYRYLPFFQVTTGGRYVYLRDLRSGSVWGVNHEPPHPGQRALHEDLHPLMLTQDAHRAASDPPFPLPPAPRGFAEYECVHGEGTTRFRSLFEEISATFEVSVPPEEAVELWRVEVENRGGGERELAIMPAVGLILGGGTAMVGNYPTYNAVDWNPREGVLHAVNQGVRLYGLPNLHAALAAAEPPEGISSTLSGSYAALMSGEAPDDIGQGEPVQALFLHRLKLDPGEKRTLLFALAAGTDGDEVKKRALTWARPERQRDARRRLDDWWRELHGRFEIDVPDRELREFANGWLQVELLQCARWTRGGGNRGYRDVLQDAWGIAALDPARSRRLIVETLARQYPSGWAPRSYPPVEGCPLGTRRSSDSPLWIPLALGGYLRETGEVDLLGEEVCFLESEETGTVIQHAERAVRFVFGERGSHGLPLIREGDWNDGLDGAGTGGRGESVWLGIFFVAAARELARLCDLAGREAEAEEARSLAGEVRRAVEEHGWDGEYYRRGFLDDGEVIGSRNSAEGKIFLLPQAWAVLAGLGDEDERRQVLAAVDRELETAVGPKLLHPAYTVRDPRIGRITARAPGTSDNAGVQTHAAVMKAAADFAAGRAEEGYRTLRALAPFNPERRRGGPATPPFVLNSQTIGPENPRFGAMEIAWLTGAAGWFFRVVGESLLGIRPELEGLRIDPCVPSAWSEFGVTRFFRGALYRITVDNAAGVTRGVREVRVAGRVIEGSLIPAGASGEVEVRVVMG